MIYKNLIVSNNYSSDKCMVLPTGKEQIAVTYTASTLSVPELYIFISIQTSLVFYKPDSGRDTHTPLDRASYVTQTQSAFSVIYNFDIMM